MTKSKFTWLLVSLIMIGFFITGLVSYRIAHDTLEVQIKNDSLPLTSDNIYSEIQQDLIRPIFISSLMAQDTFVRNWTLSGESDTNEIIQYLGEIKKQYNTVTAFFVSDLTKNYYHYSSILKKVDENNDHDSWYFRVKNLGANKEYEINIDHDTANPDQVVVFVNYRVYDFENNFIGVIGVGLSSNTVAELIEKYKMRYEREIFFIDDTGMVTLQGSKPLSFSSIQQNEGLKTLAPEILSSSNMSGSYIDENGSTIYISTRWVEEFQWHIIVQQIDRFDNNSFFRSLFNNFGISVLVSLLVIFVAQLSFRGYQSRLEQMATVDTLTGAYNRQGFDTLVAKSMKNAKHTHSPLTIAMLDIDHFKSINDKFGHLAGDNVLQQVAKTCQSELRKEDAFCRWGGEEFIVILPGLNIHDATRAMERLTRSIERQPFDPKVTVSIGVSQLQEKETVPSLIRRADKAMYLAKEQGRNQVYSDR
ncbi:sensor domain-containing diguanylate cyclase [Vibrio sp. RC27]